MNSVNVLTNEKDAVKDVEKNTTAVKGTKAVVKKAIAKAVKAEKEEMKVKAVEKKAEENLVQEKKETAKKEVVKKEAAEKDAVKKEAVKKEPTKKTVAKKSTVSKSTVSKADTAKKEEVMGKGKEEIFIQTSSNEMCLEAIIEKVKKAYVAEGNVETKDDQIRIYIKPEENMVYYVVNNSYASGINLFEA